MVTITPHIVLSRNGTGPTSDDTAACFAPDEITALVAEIRRPLELLLDPVTGRRGVRQFPAPVQTAAHPLRRTCSGYSWPSIRNGWGTVSSAWRIPPGFPTSPTRCPPESPRRKWSKTSQARESGVSSARAVCAKRCCGKPSSGWANLCAAGATGGQPPARDTPAGADRGRRGRRADARLRRRLLAPGPCAPAGVPGLRVLAGHRRTGGSARHRDLGRRLRGDGGSADGVRRGFAVAGSLVRAGITQIPVRPHQGHGRCRRTVSGQYRHPTLDPGLVAPAACVCVELRLRRHQLPRHRRRIRPR
jgi:hypothetical protein